MRKVIRAYRQDPVSLVWLTDEHSGFEYSDGDDVEERIRLAVTRSQDVSSASTELTNHITDWPSDYHLNPVRHNLLRPFNFRPDHRVLELGCGCGAITRYLGETGALVIAVEGSRKRAEIAAERCRDLPNVSVYCDNLTDFSTEGRFDYVTLIGVLEYAPMLTINSDPIGTYLEVAHEFLNRDGALLIAIENQLGLKYFSGAREDHVGISYFGIEDRYRSDTPITFGRHELHLKLSTSRFFAQRWYFPFPDYKLPELILSESALTNTAFHPDYLLSRFSTHRQNDGGRCFREFLAWPAIVRNRLLADLSNSFLVEARLTQKQPTNPQWLGACYASKRTPQYQTSTQFYADGASIQVVKRLLHPGVEHKRCPLVTHHFPATSSYYPTHSHAQAFHQLVAKQATFPQFVDWATVWLKHLETLEVNGKLRPEALDAVPGNLLIHDGIGIFIDLEWQWHESPPLTWVLLRGILDTLQRGCPRPSRNLGARTMRSFAIELFAQSGIRFDPEDFTDAATLEFSLRNAIGPVKPQDEINLSSAWDRPLDELVGDVSFIEGTILSYQNTIAEMKGEIAQVKKESDRVKNTVSWKITKPLRAIWNVGRRFGSYVAGTTARTRL